MRKPYLISGFIIWMIYFCGSPCLHSDFLFCKGKVFLQDCKVSFQRGFMGYGRAIYYPLYEFRSFCE